MELLVKILCPTCGGDQVRSEHDGVSLDENEEKVYTDMPCPCVDTETPGFKVTGIVDISDFADTVNDILDKVIGIKENWTKWNKTG